MIIRAFREDMNLISKFSKEFRFLLCVMTFIVNMRGVFFLKRVKWS